MGKTKEVSSFAGDFSPNISKTKAMERKRKRRGNKRRGNKMTGRGKKKKKTNKPLSEALTETISSVTLTFSVFSSISSAIHHHSISTSLYFTLSFLSHSR